MEQKRDQFRYGFLDDLLADFLSTGGELSYRSKERILTRPEKTAEGSEEVRYAKVVVLTTICLEPIES